MKLIKARLTIQHLLISTCLIIFGVLVFETPQHNVGYADSDEFLAVAHQWGVAHSPGYAVYTGVLHAAMKLPLPWTTATQRAHMVSSLSVTIALYITGLTLYLLLTSLYKGKQKQLYLMIATVLSLLVIVSNKQLYLYGSITEKYVFSLPFLALLYYAATKIFFSKTIRKIDCIVLGASTGILLAHHQSMVFILPFLALLYWLKVKKNHVAIVVPLVGSFLGAIVVSGLILYWRMQVAPDPSWSQQPGLQGFIDMVSRADFRGNIYYTNTQSSGYFHSINIPQMLHASLTYLTLQLKWMYWWVIVPLIIALVVIYKHYKHYAVILVGPLLMVGVAMAAYLGWPEEFATQGITARFYVPSVILFGPLLAIGILEILQRLEKSAQILGAAKRVSMGISLSLPTILVIFTLATSIRLVDFKNFTLVKDIYGKVLESVEENALLTCYSDTSCFALLYEQTVNRKRPDVTVVPLHWPLTKKTLEPQQLQRFSYDANPYRMFDIVTWNLDKQPVYAVDISQYYFTMYGIDRALMYYIPSGYYGKLSRQMVETTPHYDISYSQALRMTKVPEFDFMRRTLVYSVTQTHLTNSYMLLLMGERAQAQQELNTGVNLAYSLYQDEKQGAGAARIEVEKTIVNENFAYGKKVPTADELFPYIADFLEKKQNSRAFYMAVGAITVDPLHVPSRLELAKMYLNAGDTTFARIELKNILMVDSNHKEAQQLLQSL